jgi:hypothetical protein
MRAPNPNFLPVGEEIDVDFTVRNCWPATLLPIQSVNLIPLLASNHTPTLTSNKAGSCAKLNFCPVHADSQSSAFLNRASGSSWVGNLPLARVEISR